MGEDACVDCNHATVEETVCVCVFVCVCTWVFVCFVSAATTARKQGFAVGRGTVCFTPRRYRAAAAACSSVVTSTHTLQHPIITHTHTHTHTLVKDGSRGQQSRCLAAEHPIVISKTLNAKRRLQRTRRRRRKPATHTLIRP